jgi:hypothetical protein
MYLKIKQITLFLGYILISIITTYYLPRVFSVIWYVIVLVIYWYSEDESFWFAFFLVITDGFMGFFGLYETTLSIFPGLPPIEISQIYIIFSVLKARMIKPAYLLFYRNILKLMALYLIFLIITGFVIGINSSLQDYFKILKTTLPFLLFYSIPRLLKNNEDFLKIYSLFFLISLFALFGQLFEIINIQPVPSFLGAKEQVDASLLSDEPMRSFYNTGIVLLSMFGSMYYFAKKQIGLRGVYLNFITLVSFIIAFLSATRGWIIGFGISLTLFLIINLKFSLKRLIGSLSLIVIVYFILMSFPLIKNQVVKSFDRFITVERITEGDISADDTQQRTTFRGPRVMKKWLDSPIIGLGFSEEYKKSSDSHVGNQNILLHSGIIGFSLMLFFFLNFNLKMISTAINTSNYHLLVFVIFFIGWYFIHSTSGQHFAYLGIPKIVMPIVLFFCFGAYCVEECMKANN